MSINPVTTSYATQRQVLWTVGGFPGYFSAKSGGDRQADTAMHYDGGSLNPIPLSGPPNFSNVTLTKMFRPETHFTWLQKFRSYVGTAQFTLTEQLTDADLKAYRGLKYTYSGCILVKCTAPAFDASSSDPQTVELEFAVRYVK